MHSALAVALAPCTTRHVGVFGALKEYVLLSTTSKGGGEAVGNG